MAVACSNYSVTSAGTTVFAVPSDPFTLWKVLVSNNGGTTAYVGGGTSTGFPLAVGSSLPTIDMHAGETLLVTAVTGGTADIRVLCSTGYAGRVGS